VTTDGNTQAVYGSVLGLVAANLLAGDKVTGSKMPMRSVWP
jgi:hypothetical protein